MPESCDMLRLSVETLCLASQKHPRALAECRAAFQKALATLSDVQGDIHGVAPRRVEALLRNVLGLDAVPTDADNLFRVQLLADIAIFNRLNGSAAISALLRELARQCALGLAKGRRPRSRFGKAVSAVKQFVRS